MRTDPSSRRASENERLATAGSFRTRARQAVERAKAELNSLQPDRLRYAVLELRFAMEALTYERVENYKDDLPADALSKWQPRKLLQAILDIFPDADQSCTLRAFPGDATDPPTGPLFLGREDVLGLSDLKRHYDALGSFLHMPTIGQIESGFEFDAASLRSRCEALLALLETALASSMHNVRFGSRLDFVCQRCGSEIRKGLPLGEFSIETACQKCGAGYSIRNGRPGHAGYAPLKDDHVCPSCSATVSLWRDEFKPGFQFPCPCCKETLLVVVGLVQDPRESETSD